MDRNILQMEWLSEFELDLMDSNDCKQSAKLDNT